MPMHQKIPVDDLRSELESLLETWRDEIREGENEQSRRIKDGEPAEWVTGLVDVTRRRVSEVRELLDRE